MLGELLGEMALNIVGDAVSDVAPFAFDAGSDIAKRAIDFAVDKINSAQKIKTIKDVLGVESDVYLNDAIAYWDLLDNINYGSFESQKARLMKV